MLAATVARNRESRLGLPEAVPGMNTLQINLVLLATAPLSLLLLSARSKHAPPIGTGIDVGLQFGIEAAVGLCLQN